MDAGTAQPDPLSATGIGEAAQLDQHEVDNQGSQHLEGSWTQEEREAFNLGMCLFGKYFPAIQCLVGTKAVQEVVLFYYAEIKFSSSHRRWREDTLDGGVKGEAIVTGRRQARLLTELGREMDLERHQEALQCAEQYNHSKMDLESFLQRLIALAGRDTVVRCCNLSPASQAEDPQVLTHANIGGLLNSKQSTKGIFWDVVWPQLAKAGWTSDQVPLKPSGCIFFPPSTPSGQPPPLDSIPDVLQYLHARPELLPKTPQTNSSLPEKRQLSAGHARARAALPKKAFCDSQAAAEQQHLLQRCPSSQPPQEPTAVAHIQLGGSLRDAPTAKAPAAAAADGKCQQRCANCQTTYTPLWRKDRSTGLVMCNACGIYFKNHGRHRPLELIESAGSGAFGRGGCGDGDPAAPRLPPIKAEVRRLVASNSSPCFLNRALSEADQSLDSTQMMGEDDYGPGLQRRSSRQRRAREWGDDVAADWTGYKGSQSDDYSDEGGSDMGEDEAEEQRLTLITRLLSNSAVIDYDGAIQTLAYMKKARVMLSGGGGDQHQSWGVLRVYRDPHPASPVSSPSAAASETSTAARSGAIGLARKSNLGKPLQRRGSPPVNGAKGTGTICANCQTTSTPLWRKDRPSGLIMCNACGIYLKTHGRNRPVDGQAGLARTGFPLKRTASKSLKKRRSNSLTTSQSTGHASYRERLSLSRFDSADLPSCCTSLTEELAQPSTQETVVSPPPATAPKRVADTYAPADLHLQQQQQLSQKLLQQQPSSAWDQWSPVKIRVNTKPAGLAGHKAHTTTVPIHVDARASSLQCFQVGGTVPAFKWSEEGGLVHPATPPRGRMLGALPSHLLQRQGSSADSGRIVHALFAPAAKERFCLPAAARPGSHYHT
ncbi:g2176 [Coccomyxa elongata]